MIGFTTLQNLPCRVSAHEIGIAGQYLLAKLISEHHLDRQHADDEDRSGEGQISHTEHSQGNGDILQLTCLYEVNGSACSPSVRKLEADRAGSQDWLTFYCPPNEYPMEAPYLAILPPLNPMG
jgi:hypothetical protein